MCGSNFLVLITITQNLRDNIINRFLACLRNLVIIYSVFPSDYNESYYFFQHLLNAECSTYNVLFNLIINYHFASDVRYLSSPD